MTLEAIHSDSSGGVPRLRALARWLASAALLIVAWSLPAALNVMMELLVRINPDAPAQLWQRVVATALPWYVWAPFTPVVCRLVRRRPLLRPLSLVAVGAHLGLYAVITLAFVITLQLARHALGLPPRDVGAVVNALQWSPFAFLAYAAVAGIAHAALYAKRARDEAIERAMLAEELARAQLEALRMQLHPHFLFNALNSISMLVRDRDADTAVRLIAELGGILRELLRDSAGAATSLRDEIDLVGRYLAIEQVRFGERLEIQWYIDPELLDAAVPALIMQPMVENAIRHGIARGTGPAWIRIEAASRGDTLVLTVSDNGPEGPRTATPSATPSAAQPPSAPRRGLGLANTRARLRRLYGDGAYVRLTRTEEQVTLATIALPLARVAGGVPDGAIGRSDAIALAELPQLRHPASPFRTRTA